MHAFYSSAWILPPRASAASRFALCAAGLLHPGAHVENPSRGGGQKDEGGSKLTNTKGMWMGRRGEGKREGAYGVYKTCLYGVPLCPEPCLVSPCRPSSKLHDRKNQKKLMGSRPAREGRHAEERTSEASATEDLFFFFSAASLLTLFVQPLCV